MTLMFFSSRSGHDDAADRVRASRWSTCAFGPQPNRAIAPVVSRDSIQLSNIVVISVTTMISLSLRDAIIQYPATPIFDTNALRYTGISRCRQGVLIVQAPHIALPNL